MNFCFSRPVCYSAVQYSLLEFGMENDSSTEKHRILGGSFLQNKTCMEKFLVVVTVTLLLSVVLLAVILALVIGSVPGERKQDVCITPACIQISSRVYSSIDWDVDPCNDFYNYACGAWIDRNVIPEDESSYAIFPTTLRKKRNVILRHILEQDENNSDIEAEKKAKKMYKSCLNISNFGNNDTKVIFKLIEELGGWPVLGNQSMWTEKSHDLIALLSTASKYMNSRGQFMVSSNPVIDVHVSEDIKNTTRYVLVVDQPTLGMMGRDYYLKGRHSEMLEAYQILAKSFAIELGANPITAQEQAEELVNLEMDLANASLLDSILM